MARRAEPWAVLALIVFSALMAWVLERGQSFHQPDRLRPAFGSASWLGYPGGSEVLYLRRVVSFPELPKRAWIVASAVDELEVFVNGRRIGSEQHIGGRPMVVYDVTRLLDVGLNVIGVRSKTTTNQGPAQAIARLEWQGLSAKRVIVSDREWRAEARQRFSAQGTVSWSQKEYRDFDWGPAAVTAPGTFAWRKFVNPDLPLPMVERGPVGEWVWQPNRAASSAGFERVFEIEDSYVRGAWLGVATSGVYFFSVNGIVVGPVSGGERRMGVFDIAEYLRRGENRVTVQVAGNTRPLRVAVSGLVEAASGQLDFSTDARWHNLDSRGPAVLLGDVRHELPALTEQNAVVRNVWWPRFRTKIGYFSITLGLVSLVGWAFTASSFFNRGWRDTRAWVRYAQPFAATSLLLVLVQLIDWDPRNALEWVYPFWLPALSFGVIIAWLACLVAFDYFRQRETVGRLQEQKS
jgi:hypothetical protein